MLTQYYKDAKVPHAERAGKRQDVTASIRAGPGVYYDVI